MDEKVKIPIKKEKTLCNPFPEKNRIQTALPIQSTHLKTVRIRKNKANESVPAKDILTKGS